MTRQRSFPSTQYAANCPNATLTAVIHTSQLLLRSSVTGKVSRSIPLDHQPATGCRSLRWFRGQRSGPTFLPSDLEHSTTSRLLLADDDSIHVYDASDPQRHARISGVSGNAGYITHVDFGYTPDEVMVFSDFSLKATIWSLVTSRGVEIRDPKFPSRGSSFRPRTGHLAILTRETTKDVVMVLGPGIRQLEHSFSLGTVDAQGLKWSPDGRWLVTWEAACAGYNVLVYTPDGHLFTTYSGEHDADSPGLGVRTLIWEPSERFLVIAGYDNRITLLSTTTFKPLAILHHASTINTPNASIWQEQIDAFRVRSYTSGLQPACPPSQSTFSADKKSSQGVSHLIANASGTLLASSSEATPTTVWIWSLSSLTPLAVLIHHSPVKSLLWNPQDPSLLLIHCGTSDPIVHIWHEAWGDPQILIVPLAKVGGRMEASWVYTPNVENPSIMLANPHNFAFRKLVDDAEDEDAGVNGEEADKVPFEGLGPEDMFDEGNSMDLSPIRLSNRQFGLGFEGGGDEEVDDTFDYRRHIGVAG